MLQEAVGRKCKTIYSLLGLKVRNDFRTGKQIIFRAKDAPVLRNRFIVIDEVSMGDDALWENVAKGTVDCRFLLVGDRDQLAPVGQKAPPIFNKGYTTCVLKTPMRQDGHSEILELAAQLRHSVKTGEFKPINVQGRDVIPVLGTEFRDLVESKFTEDAPPDRAKIICWKNETVQLYNDHIRGMHYDEPHFVAGETVMTNDPIMGAETTVYATDELVEIVDATPSQQRGIDGYLYTLSRGIVVFQAANQQDVKVLLKAAANKAKQPGGSWMDYFNIKESFADLRAIHAATCWKTQGETYHNVFVDLDDIGECHQWETVARMLYVAVTRAKHRVYLYGKLPSKYTNFSHKI